MGSTSYIAIGSYTVIIIIYIISLKSSAQVGKTTASENVSIPEEIKVLGQFRYKFFTLWTFMLQIVFLLTAILDETSKLFDFSVPTQKRLGRTRAFLFNSLVLPCSLLVTTIFWSVWHIDRELIFPKVLDRIFPVWLNHILHTFIVVPLIIELSLPKKYHFVRFKNASKVLIVYATFYQLLYFLVYLRHGVWLYGIYAVMNWPQRILYTLFQLCVMLVYQKIGIAIQERKRTNKTRKID